MALNLLRARWLEGRVNELPAYCTFLYNVLLDQTVPDHAKEHAFGALWYCLEGGDLIPPEQQDLGGVDSAVFALRSFKMIYAAVPKAVLASYEDALAAGGISPFDRMNEAPSVLGSFYTATSARYLSRINRFLPQYKNAIQTGYLVKLLSQFLRMFQPQPWPQARLERVEAFLDNYQLPR